MPPIAQDAVQPAVPIERQPRWDYRLPIHRRLTAALRILPSFVIVGVHRGGTTFLYRKLSEHPCVGAAHTKEVHFFNYNFEFGPAWYRSNFPLASDAWRNRLLGRPTFMTGEASPYYMFNPLAARRMAEMLPDVKVIALLRNPVDRAHSHYHKRVRKGDEPLPFEAAMAAEMERLAATSPEAAESATVEHLRYMYLSRGMYADQLPAWFANFAPRQILVVKSEDLYSRSAETFGQVLRFLNLPDWQPSTFRAPRQGRYEPMANATRAWLDGYFAPHNRRLEELLGRRFDWGH